MANDNWDDEYGEGQQDADGPKQLREAFERQKKETAKLRKEYESLLKKQRQADVKSYLEEVGANPKVARFVLQDVEDVTKEAVVEWVNENGELFGISLDEPKDDAPAAPPAGMSPEEANALAAVNQFHAQPAGTNLSQDEAKVKAAIQEANGDPNKLAALLGLNKIHAF